MSTITEHEIWLNCGLFGAISLLTLGVVFSYNWFTLATGWSRWCSALSLGG